MVYAQGRLVIISTILRSKICFPCLTEKSVLVFFDGKSHCASLAFVASGMFTYVVRAGLSKIQ